MNDITTFTIVTPSYNQGNFLAETIESVLSQEGAFSIEYIVADGGSTDNSLDIIKRYDARLRRGEWPVNCLGITFRWFSEKDNGQTCALMKGFRLGTGGIFAWINSDDGYLPLALQAASTFFRDQPGAGLVYGDSYYCNTAGTVIGGYPTEEFDLDSLASFNFICQPSAFFRRAVFEEVGGLDESLHFAMDLDLWIRIGRRFPCRYLPRVLSKYRLHEASKTINNKTLHANIEEGLTLAIKYFDWAPLTRVYASCNCSCQSVLPAFLTKSRVAVICFTLVYTVVRSICLNRGLRRKELKLLKLENFRKLFKSRMDVMTGKRDLF